MHEKAQLSEMRVNSVPKIRFSPRILRNGTPDLFSQCHGTDMHWTSALRQSATDNPIKIAVY